MQGMNAARKTYFAEVLDARGIKQADICRAIDANKQQVNKLYLGKNPMTEKWARQIAPHLGLTWAELLEGEAAKKRAPGGESRMVVGQPRPVVKEGPYKTDEEALLAAFSRLSLVKKAELFARLGIEEMPSLSRKDN